MVNLRFFIGDREVSENEALEELARRIGLKDLILDLPQDRFFALEYGLPLPKSQATFQMIRASLKKERNLVGAELEAQTKKQYAIFTDNHLPHPFIDSINDGIAQITSEDVYNHKMMKILETAVKDRLEEYNNSGVCTLGLADFIKFHEDGELNDGKNEYEAV
jgi:hypothetical protein